MNNVKISEQYTTPLYDTFLLFFFFILFLTPAFFFLYTYLISRQMAGIGYSLIFFSGAMFFLIFIYKLIFKSFTKVIFYSEFFIHNGMKNKKIFYKEINEIVIIEKYLKEFFTINIKYKQELIKDIKMPYGADNIEFIRKKSEIINIIDEWKTKPLKKEI